jgi:hypothetical protein
MIVTPTDARRIPLVSLLALLLVLTGCNEQPSLTDERISNDDCLRDVKVDKLDEAMARCNSVVAAFPRDPRPLSDRFVLHTLKQEQVAACRDIVQAAALLVSSAARSKQPDDPQLLTDIRVRQESCRDKPPLPNP